MSWGFELGGGCEGFGGLCCWEKRGEGAWWRR